MNEALRDWVTNVDNTFYIIGTVAGPHPIRCSYGISECHWSRGSRAVACYDRQAPRRASRLRWRWLECHWAFPPFLSDNEVAMYGVEAGGKGWKPVSTQRH